MRNDCSIVRDILPLYIENMVSEETKAFVEEHLASCADWPARGGENEKAHRVRS